MATTARAARDTAFAKRWSGRGTPGPGGGPDGLAPVDASTAPRASQAGGPAGQGAARRAAAARDPRVAR